MKNILRRFKRKFVTFLIKIKNKNVSYGIGNLLNKNVIFGGYNSIGDDNVIIDSSFGFASYCSNNCNIAYTKIGKYCCIGRRFTTSVGLHPAKKYVSIHPAFYSIAKQSGFSFVNENKFKEIDLLFENKYCVKIGNDVWIGDNVTVLSGIEIGDGAIIAAGAVVTKNVEPYSIVGGVPARFIRYRFTNEQKNMLEVIKWWNRDISWIRENVNLFMNIEEFCKKK